MLYGGQQSAEIVVVGHSVHDAAGRRHDDTGHLVDDAIVSDDVKLTDRDALYRHDLDTKKEGQGGGGGGGVKRAKLQEHEEK